jgi:tRNA 5-methylaminomethyl-2-thiouridine biosynthesis bifunctional protein
MQHYNIARRRHKRDSDWDCYHADMQETLDPILPAQVDWRDHQPFQSCYDDGYFGSQDGLSEARAVFIEANALPQRFAALKPGQVFVIGETGFGTGLNMLLAAQCFEAHAPTGAKLQLVSVDLHPLSTDDLKRAVGLWPELSRWSEALVTGYPPAAPGHHRLHLSDDIELTLMWGDALSRWSDSHASVDAWFLDGFSPAHNPNMWSQELFQVLYDHSRPGASFGTFTAAGHVRRALAEVGFVVEKAPGFGHKRHRISGHKTGQAKPRQWRCGHAVVAGAGLAGATTAWALAQRGWQVTVMDPNPPASGASGNLAGVVYATPSPHLQAQNRFYLAALIRALCWFRHLGFPQHPSEGRLSDVWLHLHQARRQQNALKAHQTGAWPKELLHMERADLVCLKGAGYIKPKLWIERLLQHPNIRLDPHALVGLSQLQSIGDVDAIVLANAEASRQWSGLETLPMKAIRGQVTEVQSTKPSSEWTQAHCHAGYLTPAIDGRHCVGATYDLHGKHQGLVAEDDVMNLATLADHLPEAWAALGGEKITLVGHRAATRCTIPDRLPLVGELAHLDSRLYLNVGHGSRGITHTPLCADLLADLIGDNWKCGGLAADQGIVKALRPQRYLDKKATL